MRRHWIIVLALLLVLSNHPLRAGAQPPAEPSPAAAEFARRLAVGQLELMVMQAIAKTSTFQMLAKRHDQEVLTKYMTQAVIKVVPKHRADWERNLASAYARHLTDEEMASLAEGPKTSPYFDKFQAAYPLAAAEMREASMPILEKAAAEVLADVLDAAAKQP